MFEIRYNPIAGEWVVVAAQRMKRPVLPTDSCPFCPGVGKTPSDYDVFVYQNDYPSMTLATPADPWVRTTPPDGIDTGGSETPPLHTTDKEAGGDEHRPVVLAKNGRAGLRPRPYISTSYLGSVIAPVTALAATVAGDAR